MTTVASLHGTLSDFGIDDVLRLLCAGDRSGFVLVTPSNSDESVADASMVPARWLIVSDGSILLGGSTRTNSLGRALVSSGTVAAHDLPDSHAADDDEIEQLNMLANIVELTTIYPIVREQVLTTVFEMVMIDDGDVQFIPTEPHPLGRDFAFSLDGILSEARSMVQSWRELTREGRLTDSTMVRAVQRRAPQQGAVTLSHSDWSLLMEATSPRSLSDLTVASGFGRHTVFTIVNKLLSSGCLEYA